MPTDGTTARGRTTRAHILDVAMAQFAEAGYRGSSLRDIAARAGLSHPGVLYHFPTKEALLTEVLAHRDIADDLANPLASRSGVEGLRNLAATMDLNERRPGIVELYVVLSAEATAADHPAHEYFRRRYTGLIAKLALTFAAARADGQLRAGVDPDTAARHTVAIMDGLQVQWLLHRDSTPLSALLRAHLQSLITVDL